MEAPIPFSVRSSSGVSLFVGPPKFEAFDSYKNVQTKSCRSMIFSPDGNFFAYLDGSLLNIVKTDTWKDVAAIESKAYHLAFSPKGTFILSWELFTVSKANPEGTPNLKMYRSETGELVKTFTQKKQVNWAPQWSADEKLFSRLVNTDVVFYADLNFEKIVARLNCYKVKSYQLSPNVGNYFILCHTLGTPGQPSFGRLFKFPDFDIKQSLADKSFFQADKVDFLWNSKGNNALLLTSTEVDKTGGSYYGKQGLHFMSLNGQTSMVTMSKEGPIYSVEWSPKNQEFCVVYGFMPSKATVFNLKCEPVFELGTGSRNSIYYNPHGNVLLLSGFGNLRGHVETWDTANWKMIGQCEAPDTTLLEWSPDGVHFLTATTAPRLRIGNGYKIWHVSGSLLYEKSCEDEELYEVTWKTFSKYTFKEPSTSGKVTGIAISQPQASKQAYVPPSQRNRGPVGVTFKVDDEIQAHRPGSNQNPTKAALKQKKKREAKKAKKLEEGGEEEENNSPVTSAVAINLTGDPEKDKKLKSLKQKLDAIEKLKKQQAEGKPLEINQLAKIKGEADLLKQLELLQL